jgi:hypothetical protein|tara:strand:- start:75 stop:638 length:564 start_codon:yes stop_codon:yes gene_type:complete
MKNFITPLILGMLMVAGFSSCRTYESFFEDSDLVFTTPENVAEGVSYAPVPLDQLPENVRDAIPEGTQVVVVEKEDLVSEDSAHIPLSGALGDTAIGTAFDAGMSIAKTFIPGLAGWEALLVLLFRRKRKHYVNAFRSIVPLDKKVDVGSAVASVGAALGMTHSSPQTEAVFDAEEWEYEEEEENVI